MELDINTKREFDFYWYQLFAASNENIIVSPPSKFNKMSIPLIKAKLSVFFNNSEDESIVLNKIKKDCEQYLLTDSEISWLNKKSDRLTNWLWFLIINNRSINNLFVNFKFNSNHQPAPSTVFPINQSSFNQAYPKPNPSLPSLTEESSLIDLFKTFNFNDKAYPTQEKHEIILKYFDLSLLNKQDKLSLINLMIDKWHSIESLESFIWLDKNNNQQANWAINYFIEYCKKNNIQPHDMININFESNYYKLILLFDTWNVYPDTKKLFSQSIRKASSQKKHRDKQVGKKQCSFNLSEKNIRQLASLSKCQGKPKNHILESLINSKYQEMINSNK